MPLENIILDLDETILSSMRILEYIRIGVIPKDLEYLIFADEYITFIRPQLEKFLDYIFDNFNVAVWTAATESYADFMVENIIMTKTGRKLDFIFHRGHCDIADKLYGGKKNLELVWEVIPNYNKQNTILIDDLPETYDLQPKNVIEAPAFNYLNNNPNEDNFLLYLIDHLDYLR
jgi:TFIIF-interacting CTD phosphatase-like protein